MKISLNKQVLDLQGNLVSPESAGKILANALYYQPEGDSLKIKVWSHSLFKDEEIELNKEDFEWLKKFVDTNRKIEQVIKIPILEALGEFKD